MPIIASGTEHLPIRGEFHRCHRSRMSGKRIDVSSLQQIDNLHRSIIASRDQIVAGRVKVQRVHRTLKYPVVLDQLPNLDVENLDACVVQGNGHQRSVRMPSDFVPCSLLIHETVNALSGLGIEQFQRPVVSAGSYQFIIWTEPRATHPIRMASERGHEVLPRYLPQLHRFIIRGRYQLLPLRIEIN